jgi:acid phosphatase
VPNGQPVTKLLTIVEENHSLEQMKAGMPYLYSLAQRFSYADNYVAIRHPSLPNYLAIAGGDTFGVSDDAGPASHPLGGQSVFGQAIAQGRTAGVYAESMPGNCAQSSSAGYVVKHNPWPYFVDERALCNVSDTPEAGFGAAVDANALPNAGMLIPNLCNDAHDCSLGTADSWLKNRLPNILASSDFTNGKLAVVVTADEDDSASGNKVLTVVLHASLDGSHKVVSTALTHYSLSRFYSQTNGGSPLRKAAAAPDMAEAFGLTVGPTSP